MAKPHRPELVEAAERRFYESVGVEARPRRVPLRRLDGEVRVMEAGDGPPVVFVHGTVTAGASWADLVAELPGFRCIIVDRPGCGLSAPLPMRPKTIDAHRVVGDELIADLLDGLDLASAHVIAPSLGGWFTFRSAAAHPDRIDKIVGMGFQCGAEIEGAPPMMRLSTPPWMASRFSVSPKMVGRMLKVAGMRNAVETGRLGTAMLDWMAALLNHTHAMRNELEMVPRPIGLRGPIAETRHSPGLLARVTAPTHLFWGDDDIFGGEETARKFAGLLPTATLEMAAGAGHAPWLDAPEQAATAVRSHLLE